MLNNAPPVVKNLIIINVLFYLATMALGEYQMLHYFAGTYPGSPNFYPWQVITHMFMHGGLGHIFFNMFALYMFGGQLERLWGPQRFLNYYIICGLGGFFLQRIFFSRFFFFYILLPLLWILRKHSINFFPSSNDFIVRFSINIFHYLFIWNIHSIRSLNFSSCRNCLSIYINNFVRHTTSNLCILYQIYLTKSSKA